jgi:tRNA (guanine6-N2)-methyltransferase
MVRCANVVPGAFVVDPFCGSGTLLLEALDTYHNSIKCMGIDVSKRSTDGARENALAEGYGSDVCEFIPSDARGLRRILQDNSVDAIITNLPWGVMTGHKNKSELQTMYEVFLRTSWYVLKDRARVVMLVLRGLQLTRLIRKLAGRYRLLRVRVVRTANNLPCIIVVEKLPVDEVRESVKGQLSYLSQYVSFSPEVYEAIHHEAFDNEIP